MAACRPGVSADKWWPDVWSAACSGCSWFKLEDSWRAALKAAYGHCADAVASADMNADASDRLWNRWAGAWAALSDIDGELYGDEPVTAERREYLRACRARFAVARLPRPRPVRVPHMRPLLRPPIGLLDQLHPTQDRSQRLTATCYITFGQKYRWEIHPVNGNAHPDGWFEFTAPTYGQALRLAQRYLMGADTNGHPMPLYAFDYDEERFDPVLYPRGCLARFDITGAVA